MKSRPQIATLRVPARLQQWPAMRDFLEATARAFGFGDSDCLRMALGGEEIFTYVCSLDTAGSTMEVTVTSVGYQLRVSFLFDAAAFDPWAFNLGARVALDDEAALDNLGLLIASRAVDSFAITMRQNGRVELQLIKDKTYPEAAVSRSAGLPRASAGAWQVRAATEADMRDLVSSLPESDLASAPTFLRSPAHLQDRVASGDYGIVVAVNADQVVLGGMLWHERNARVIECFGPYLTATEASACGSALVAALLERVAKQRALCLLSRWATPALPEREFEWLGDMVLRDSQGNEQGVPIRYRQLKEDMGTRVWVTPDIDPFLRTEYDRLFFAREMIPAIVDPAARPAHSVFAAAIDRARQAVTLTAVLDGVDAETNLQRQLAALAQEGMQNIFFEMDLAVAWQAALTPILLRHDFHPKLVMPYAGQSDILLFQKAFG